MKLYILAIVLMVLFYISCDSGSNNPPGSKERPAAVSPSNEKGKQLFQTRCALCHHPIKDLTGPALKGVRERVPGKDWLYRYIQNPAGLREEGDHYAIDLYEKWNKAEMTPFPGLSHEEIDLIMDYCDQFE